MMESKSFGQPPNFVDVDAVAPYSINIASDKVQRMQKLIELSPVPTPCYKNSLPDGNRDFGLRRDWFGAAKKRWETHFDWDKQQARFGRHNHFIAKVPTGYGEKIDIHFVALFSRAAQPAKPALLLHGWPGSFFEFLPMLDELAAKNTPATLPYHVIVPSLPSYLFSGSPPLDRDFGIEDGGDIGSRACRVLAAQYAGCRGALLNYSPMPEPPGLPPPSAEEAAGLERWEWFKTRGVGYAVMHATRPATVGLALASSPLALLAWVAEKFLDWTDPASFPPDSSPSDQALLGLEPGPDNRVSLRLMDEVLLSGSLYFLTDTPHRCLYSYRETYSADSAPPRSSHAAPEYHVRAPTKLGLSWFPLGVAPVPLSWVATTGDLVWSRRHDRGGHFAALECPLGIYRSLPPKGHMTC
ncbi:hypothetical protein RB595_010417 [Gaeumannomyces hyphopodioides]